MGTRMVHPDEVVVSEYNERQSFDPEELVDDELVASVKQSGVIEPPLVTENDDGELAAYVGQRRVAAARRAGVDEIPVIVNDVDEQEALIASITENTELFSEAVSPGDRAQAIQRLWETMGGSGTPVFSHVGATLGVSADTVRTWFEPMRDEWKGTSIDPTTSSDRAKTISSAAKTRSVSGVLVRFVGCPIALTRWKRLRGRLRNWERHRTT